MSFFKEFKEDLSQAVNELMPGDEGLDDVMPDDSSAQTGTLEDEVDVESELLKLDGLLEKVSREAEEIPVPEVEEEPVPEMEMEAAAEQEIELESEIEPELEFEPDIEVEPESEVELGLEPDVEMESDSIFGEESATEEEILPDILLQEETGVESEPELSDEVTAETPDMPTEEMGSDLSFDFETEKVEKDKVKEEAIMSNKKEEKVTENVMNAGLEEEMGVNTAEVTDETAVITTGMKIEGNITSTGSLDIQGEIKGDVTCNGKLSVTGKVTGNSNSAEFFADSAKIEGEITSVGTVKIGLGSVVIGNVKATSAVIAGAIKGDIDVQGPVVVDTSAVVVGNIKSRSVQINNGAVIEGFCSQCYADIDMDNLFGEKKGK